MPHVASRNIFDVRFFDAIDTSLQSLKCIMMTYIIIYLFWQSIKDH